MRAWTGPAISAKVFIPLGLVFFSGSLAAPIRDVFTAVWFLLVVVPLAGAAIWLFYNIGEIRPSANGILYRKWLRWQHIPASQISNVVRVFPCFAALVLEGRQRLFFFPDSDTKRVLRALPGALRPDGATTQAAGPSPARLPLTVRGVFAFLIGIGAGIAIWVFRRSAAPYNAGSSSVALIWIRYLPLFVGISLLYLTFLVVMRRLQSRELYISLALIGLGIVYLSTAAFHLL